MVAATASDLTSAAGPREDKGHVPDPAKSTATAMAKQEDARRVNVERISVTTDADRTPKAPTVGIARCKPKHIVVSGAATVMVTVAMVRLSH